MSPSEWMRTGQCTLGLSNEGVDLRLPARTGRCPFGGKLSTNFIADFVHFVRYDGSRFIATRWCEKQANPHSNSDPSSKNKSVPEHVTIPAANSFGRPRQSFSCGFVRFLGGIAQISEGPGCAVSHTFGCTVRLIQQVEANAQQGFEDLVHRGSFHDTFLSIYLSLLTKGNVASGSFWSHQVNAVGAHHNLRTNKTRA